MCIDLSALKRANHRLGKNPCARSPRGVVLLRVKEQGVVVPPVVLHVRLHVRPARVPPARVPAGGGAVLAKQTVQSQFLVSSCVF